MAVIQWNCNSLNSHHAELRMIISEHNPYFICLQETNLITNKPYSLRNYNIHRKDRPYAGHAAGGVAILSKESVETKEIKLNTNLEAIAIRTKFPFPITICSIYIPPQTNPDSQTIKTLINQLPKPYLILGDFNAHNQLWGSNYTNNRGRELEDIIINQLILLNDGSPTHFHSQNGSLSTIDLSLSYPNIAPNITWETLPHTYGSDHFPIKLKLTNNDVNQPFSPIRQKWNLNKADWTQFTEEAKSIETDLEKFQNSDEMINHLTNSITQIAKQTIGYKKNTKKRCVPWWNELCQIAISDLKKSTRQYRKNKTDENLMELKRNKSIARRIIKESKKQSWRKYVSNINPNAATKEIWNKIRKIKGGRPITEITALKTDNKTVTSAKEIAETMAEIFHNNSSDQNYHPEFLQHKIHEEQKKINLEDDQENPLNQTFSHEELTSALKDTKNDSSPGPDNIPFELLKNLPENTLAFILKIFNFIWTNHVFPKQWQEVYIIPIHKSGKSKLNPLNYRPITLSNTLCKLFEKMINKRIIWYLEKNNILQETQCGFRHGRSTTDHIVNLTCEIQKAFKNHQHLTAVFFDLEKAYDTTWRHHIVKSLIDEGIKGNIIFFIKNFLTNRKFKVVTNGHISETRTLENGLPQGAILSVTLFLVAINKITTAIPKMIRTSLFADDLVIYNKGTNVKTIETNLQNATNQIQDWTKKFGFKLSMNKTKVIHFSKSRQKYNTTLTLNNGTTITSVDKIKFLGVIFDQKLTWRPHVENLRAECLQRLNLIKALANYDWGADRDSLLTVYKAIVRSKIDYGCIAYATACPTILKKIDPIHNAAMRLITGAHRTSPTASILAEAGEPPLKIRRTKLILNYTINIANQPSHPTFKNLFEKNSNTPRLRAHSPFASFIQTLLNTTQLTIPEIATATYSNIPPWSKNQAQFNTKLEAYNKETTHQETFKNMFKEICEEHKEHTQIYTDASKINNNIGCAVYSDNHTLKIHLPNPTSIFTAETLAILKSIQYINNNAPNHAKYIIFTDCLSSLKAIQNPFSRNTLIQSIQQLIHKQQTQKNTEILFTWIPSHIGIEGNEKADSEAKEATTMPITGIKIQPEDIKAEIKQKTSELWNREWHRSNSTLRTIKNSTKPWKNGDTRREQIIITRLRIGHSNITHGHLLTRSQQENCETCHTPITIKHLLIDCPIHEEQRKKHKIPPSMNEALSNNKQGIHNVLDFLRETNLINKI